MCTYLQEVKIKSEYKYGEDKIIIVQCQIVRNSQELLLMI